MSAKHNWHEDVFFGIHYDIHANAEDTDLGKDLTHERLRNWLIKVKPDWVHCDCKGHPGYTSWPTEVGSTCPGLAKDMLRIFRDVTKELGIKLGMHYSGVWDTRAIELHPDWARIDENGNRDKNFTCLSSDYTDKLMIPQMLEIIDKYDVDGFWVDGECWAAFPCWCERCKTLFSQKTGIKNIPKSKNDKHWNTWLDFHRNLFIEHVRKYANAVHKRKPDCLVCSNWMYTLRQPDDEIQAPIDYISGDYSWCWGTDSAALEARFIESRGLSWDLMCWAFTKSEDVLKDMEIFKSYPWTMKTIVHLQQEVSEVLALGGAIMIYNTPQRTGWLTDWHQELIGEVANFCRKRKEFCFKTTTASETAILHLANSHYDSIDTLFTYGESVESVEGALHSLLENQISTDIIPEKVALERIKSGKYKLIVIPEQKKLSTKLIEELLRFANAGGHILISGNHLTEELSDFVGAKFAGKPQIISRKVKGIYIPVENQAVGIYGDWTIVKPNENVEILTCYLTDQDPEYNKTTNPVATRRKVGKGTITAIYGPIFRSYRQGHYPLIRKYIKSLIDSLKIDWQVQADGPSWLEVVVRTKNDKLLINLINRGAGPTTNKFRTLIDDLPPIKNIKLTVKSPHKPKTVKLLPENTTPHWIHDTDTSTIKINIPELNIHSVIEIT